MKHTQSAQTNRSLAGFEELPSVLGGCKTLVAKKKLDPPPQDRFGPISTGPYFPGSGTTLHCLVVGVDCAATTADKCSLMECY